MIHELGGGDQILLDSVDEFIRVELVAQRDKHLNSFATGSSGS